MVLQRKTGHDFLFQETAIGFSEARRHLHDEFIEGGALKGKTDSCFFQALLEVLCFVMVELGEVTDSRSTETGQVHGGCHGAKAVVRADIGCGLFPPDMLLTGSQGQDESLPSLHINAFLPTNRPGMFLT